MVTKEDKFLPYLDERGGTFYPGREKIFSVRD